MKAVGGGEGGGGGEVGRAEQGIEHRGDRQNYTDVLYNSVWAIDMDQLDLRRAQ